MLYGFLLVIHLIVSVLLVVTIMMQSSKGGGLAGFGGGMGGGGNAMLGGRQAATLLHKVTVVLALVFGVNALVLGGLSRTASAPHSATLEMMSEEGGAGNPLDFLGDDAITPTEGQAESARQNMPVTEEEGGDAAAGDAGESQE